ncbi:hypothetical protein AKJ09_05823 [Labilithrix luteola]|uniref:Uncharacterized protein n=1 Tax=Labilithrix luteola TaxID=1391654 RepID=A0A0K1Q182_9BACT|nr:hypothetical protein [Labilithrix luteola]AKU99159.1 hypothetical protein AKJ09_05823 [Labilithrix luteola]
MSRLRLTIQYDTGFSADLWGWRLEVTSADSGRVEIVWQTSNFEHQAKREQRIRARSLPGWCANALEILAAIDFQALPPSTDWGIGMDDVGTLAVARNLDGVRSEFSIFYAPAFWPMVSISTRHALAELVSLLDPLARKVDQA